MGTLIRRVLIANRGAIACRIARTLRRLGVESVAVFADDDAASLHVRAADRAIALGAGAVRATYLDADRILDAAIASGADAIHPGYGFLSENADFVAETQRRGLIFLGPTPEQVRLFGRKHNARAAAVAAGVPLLPGTDLLPTLADVDAAAARLGMPLMLKSTGGGGGIGMEIVRSAIELASAFERIGRLAAGNFGDAGIFMERFVEHARHVEVQVIGDGRGRVCVLGDRDCSVQRRHQKVIEEAPAPGIPAATRRALHAAAAQLAASVAWRSVGTVEFLYDSERNEFYFLEVNARLQVEHGVTEAVTGLDLVELMLRVAEDRLPASAELERAPRGHALQARLYAEDPGADHRPSAGLLTNVQLPLDVRVETWVETGVNVSPRYDPLLAKLIAHGEDRGVACTRLGEALAQTRIDGVATNRRLLADVVAHPLFASASHDSTLLADLAPSDGALRTLVAGTDTTVQSLPGRLGYWSVGVPPSGPMDARSLRLANVLVGNATTAPGLEITASGPAFALLVDVAFAVTGAPLPVLLDGEPVGMNARVAARTGQRLEFGQVGNQGLRAYLALKGGVDVPEHLGSHATFTLGGMGGHGGRGLREGDVLRLGAFVGTEPTPMPEPVLLGNDWTLAVTRGPHAAPDFFSAEYMETFFVTTWRVHHQSSRTGIRLVGPAPGFARADGGEAGLHPSNVHDNAYCVGSIDFTGDMPIILGPDGPSLGGFTCPAVVCERDLWMLGQMRAGDRVRFVEQPLAAPPQRPSVAAPGTLSQGVVTTAGDLVVRASGERCVLVEFGPPVLDVELRFRVQALLLWLTENPLRGLGEMTPGVRSLQVQFDPTLLPLGRLIDHVLAGEQASRSGRLRLPSRIVHLPLSWNDETVAATIARYMKVVRADAPWCPDNIEFIRRANGLDTADDVEHIVFSASYLVLGLGDVYLGAPVATPIDPRHRLVTTKYNPARTWTPENMVGIGGAYLCVYGMEGPGGYQLVGRTLQMWNRHRTTRSFTPGHPWLLRNFDQIRFHRVDADELLRLRRDFPLGRHEVEIETTEFDLAAHRRFLSEHAAEIARTSALREAAFAAERGRWQAAGSTQASSLSSQASAATTSADADAPELASAIAATSPVAGIIGDVLADVGARVEAGDAVAIVESMKTEVRVLAPCAGRVAHIVRRPGTEVDAGAAVLLLEATT